MMDSVVDFDEAPASASTGLATGKKLNKIERKKLKRQEQLRARGFVAPQASAKNGENGQTKVEAADVPTKSKLKRKIKASKTQADAPEIEAEPKTKKLKKRKVTVSAPSTQVNGDDVSKIAMASKKVKKVKKVKPKAP